jgi:hypothetical protein
LFSESNDAAPTVPPSMFVSGARFRLVVLGIADTLR